MISDTIHEALLTLEKDTAVQPRAELQALLNRIHDSLEVAWRNRLLKMLQEYEEDYE